MLLSSCEVNKYISLEICLVEGNKKVKKNYVDVYETGRKSISSVGKRIFGGKGKWLSLVTCLVVLLIAALALAQGAFAGMQGAHAASAKKGISSKHAVSSKHVVSSKHTVGSSKHPHSPSVIGKSTSMSVSPLSLSFSATVKSSKAPATQTVAISNGGSRALYWYVTISPSTTTWLTLLPNKGQPVGIRTASDQPGQLIVGVKPAGLSAGTYKAQVIVTGTDQHAQPITGSPQTIVVTLTVS
jgi:hypothetical protein